MYYEDMYVLLVRAEYEDLPHVLLEFGEHIGYSEGYAAHICEHGDILIERNAIDILRAHFYLD